MDQFATGVSNSLIKMRNMKFNINEDQIHDEELPPMQTNLMIDR